MELPEELAETLRIGHRCRLGDFQLELAGRQGPSGQFLRNLIDQVGVVQVPDREVNRDLQLDSALTPLDTLVQRVIQHPHRERLDQAAVFGDGDHFIRWNPSSLRMLPAQKRFHANDLG